MEKLRPPLLWNNRTIIVFCFLNSLLILLLGISIYTTSNIEDNTQQIYEYEVPLIQKTEEIRQGLAVEEVYMLNFLLSQDSIEKEIIYKQIKEIGQKNEKLYEDLEYLVNPGEETYLLNDLKKQQDRYRTLVNGYLDLRRYGAPEITVGEIAIVQKSFDRYRISINRLSKRNLEDMVHIIEKLEKNVKKSGWTTVSLTCLIFLIILSLAYVATKISKSQKKSNEVLRKQVRERRLAEEETRKYMEELKGINENKTRLISVLSHDLRSPATGLLGTVEFLDANVETLETKDIKKFTSILANAAKRLLEQLDSTLQWVKAQSVQEVFHPVPVLIHTVVKKIEKLLEENLISKSIFLYNHTDPSHQIWADPNMFHSIMQNLVSNAVKFTPRKGSVTISSIDEGKFILITVEDTGVGMSPEVMEKLFRKSTESKKGTAGESGTGLGLGLTKEFIAMNGGTISVESEEGKGTKFFVRLRKSR